MKTSDLSIKGESIQSLYGSYLNNNFLVNRRYQRKLVWSIEEKRSFIHSISSVYPVPLILLAQVSIGGERKLEIIDGLQRMNAIMSFIEQEFDLNGYYFDLDTIADTKIAKDTSKIKQKTPILNRQICADIVRYQIPLSVFQGSGDNHIDEIFRRLNSGGKHLSKQELRQAGSTSHFASIVRKLSSKIRGDSSANDILPLNDMKNISITNKDLDYGISVDDIFWVKNNIITKEDLRASKDEEVIAEIVAWIVSDNSTRSSSEILNNLYDFGNTNGTNNNISQSINMGIQKISEDLLISNIQYVFDQIIEITSLSGKSFNRLLFENQQSKIARYFQIVFYAFYELIIKDNMKISDKQNLVKLLNKSGDNVINLASGGGNWSKSEKETQSNALIGVIKKCFSENDKQDPTRNHWITKLENILIQSSTEQALYDFKIGIHDLHNSNKEINRKVFSKIIKTLTSMANTHKKSIGYCIIGIADNDNDAQRHETFYTNKAINFSSFKITGVNDEANKYHGGIDNYLNKIVSLIQQEPINKRDKDYISRNIMPVKYFDKDLIILKIESGATPSIYDKKYYVRHGNSIKEVEPEDVPDLVMRLSN